MCVSDSSPVRQFECEPQVLGLVLAVSEREAERGSAVGAEGREVWVREVGAAEARATHEGLRTTNGRRRLAQGWKTGLEITQNQEKNLGGEEAKGNFQFL